MTRAETAQLKQQFEDLRQAMTELVEVQRAAFLARHSPEASALAEPVLGRLDGLLERLQSLQQEAEQETDEEKLGIGEIDVGRINIVEPDGSLRMTISCAARAPDPTVDGYTFNRQGGNQAGIIFYNEDGDECGGLVFEGRRRDGGYDASGGLLFDQFKQDQAIGIQYRDTDGRRAAGLKVWDRPDVGFREIAERYDNAWQLPEGPERTVALQAMQDERLLGTERVFIGKDEQRSAIVMLHDLDGNVRLRLSVEASGSPKLEFLDAEGKVVHVVPGA